MAEISRSSTESEPDLEPSVKEEKQIAAPVEDSSLGVSIEFLKVFKTRFAATFKDSLTTDAVASNIVKPATKDKNVALVTLFKDQLDEANKPLVALANVFVAHAWRYEINEPFDVMEQYARENPGSYFWIDLFCNNQNFEGDLPFEYWSTNLMEAIKKIGTVLVVLSPWNAPIPVTRAWCLWEMVCALSQPDVHLAVMLPSRQRIALKNGVFKNSKSILQALADIQVEEAEATKASDLEMIFQAIRDSIGFDHVNIQVKQHIRSWLIRTLHDVGDEVSQEQTAESATLLYNIGFALKQFALYNDALHFYQLALSIRSAVLGPDHVEVGNVYNNMGVVFKNLGQFDRAIEYYNKDLEISIAARGAKHPEVASTYSNLGVAYKRKGDDAKALEYFEKDLEICVAAYGPKHPDLCPTYSNLGGVYKRRGEYEKALDFYNKDLEISIETYGPNHPDVATTYANLGALYSSQKQYETAADFYEKCLRIEAATLGATSGDTATTYANLGKMHRHLGNFDQSHAYYGKALQACLATYGEEHDEVADCYECDGFTYFAEGKLAEARESMKKALAMHTSLQAHDNADRISAWLGNHQ